MEGVLAQHHGWHMARDCRQWGDGREAACNSPTSKAYDSKLRRAAFLEAVDLLAAVPENRSQLFPRF